VRSAGLAVLHFAEAVWQQCLQGAEALAGVCVPLPVQAVALAGGADELLRILAHLITVAIHGGIVHLHPNILVAHIDHRQFVLADAPCLQFLKARVRIEPPARRFLHKRDRHGPEFPTDDKDRLGIPLFLKLEVGLRLLVESPPILALIRIVDSLELFPVLRTQHPNQRRRVIALARLQQRIHGSLRCRENLLGRLRIWNLPAGYGNAD